MGRVEDIYEISVNRAVELPGRVVVLAQPQTIVGLSELVDMLTLVECELTDAPPSSALEDADIVVIEVDPAQELSINRIEVINAAMPGIPVIAGVVSLDVRSTRALMKRDVIDVLEIPFSIEDLLGSLAEVNLDSFRKTAEPSKLAPLVSVIGCAGGVGTTTIATHLAGAFAQDGLPATLIDLDLQKGDATSYLGYSNRLSLQDLLEAKSRLDQELFSSVITSRDAMPSVLAAPTDILPIEEIDFDQLAPILKMARQDSELVVADMPIAMTSWSLSTLFASQAIVLVGKLTVHHLRKLRRQIDFLLSMGIEKERIKVVLNKAETGMFKTLKVDEAEEALRHPIFASLPDEETLIQQAQDRGELVWDQSKRTKFGKALDQMTTELLPAEDEEV